jgi:hypothetical protein
MPENTTPSSPALTAGAWLVVCVPLAWGIYFTLLNAVKLFQAVPN